jgi:hypothetical protein
VNHTGHPTYNHPEVIKAFGFREWTYEVHPDGIPGFDRYGQRVEFPKGLHVRSLRALTRFTSSAKLSDVLIHERPPVPPPDVFVCSLGPEVSKRRMCLVYYLGNCLSITRDTYNLIGVLVVSPNEVVLDGEAGVLGRFVQDKCE